MYDAGRLTEVKEDNDADGQPDRSAKVPDADAAAQPMSCDAGWMQKATSAAGAAKAAKADADNPASTPAPEKAP